MANYLNLENKGKWKTVFNYYFKKITAGHLRSYGKMSLNMA